LPPLPPGLTLEWTWGLALSGIVLGPLLILWGRVLSRPVLALAGVGIGLVLAPSLARQFGIDPTLAAVLVAVIFAAVGAVAARLIWALTGGALVATVALWTLLAYCLAALPPKEQPLFPKGLDTLEPWLIACWHFGLAGLRALWTVHSERILWTLCLGGGLPLVVLLLLPRFGKIFMTALLGSLLLTGGFLLAATSLRRAIWPSAWSDYLLYGGIILAMMMFSLVFQYIGAVTAAKAKAAKDKEQAGQGAKKPSESAKK
jgi:hypothetical protein